MSASTNWEIIIGIETHVALNTRTKLFSLAPNRFGDKANTNITEVCTGHPGSLPVLNKEAVHKAVQFGCAINARVAKFSTFDRKSYFYPDSPRNFQITQFNEPIILGGEILADVNGVPQKFSINRAHLEDDAGMLKHFPSFTGIDYNRAGIPLLEIVSEPCLRSSKEAVAYGMAIKAIMEYIDASDCNMEEGSMRMDVNISVRHKGEKSFRNKVEIKNMNSFSNMEKAIESEVGRQICAYTHNPHREAVQQATFRWDPEKKKTLLMRRKEDADDYRYFPEPDLVPLVLTDEYIDSVRKQLPELPYQRQKRYIDNFFLPEDSAFVLTSEKKLADYFEEALKTCSNAKSLCNWLIVEFFGRLKDKNKSIWNCGIASENIAKLVNMIDEEVITGKIAKKVADEMVSSPQKSCESIVAENPDYQPLRDSSKISSLIDQVVEENPTSVASYQSGQKKALGHLIGQVMKLTRGKASPKIVNEILEKKLNL